MEPQMLEENVGRKKCQNIAFFFKKIFFKEFLDTSGTTKPNHKPENSVLKKKQVGLAKHLPGRVGLSIQNRTNVCFDHIILRRNIHFLCPS